MEETHMKLSDLKNIKVLARPEDYKRFIKDGTYTGETKNAELVERDCQFNEDETRVVLNIKIGVEDNEGEVVDLYLSPNYSWSKKGNMVKILEKLDALPAPGEFIDLVELVGIPVQVVVENLEKDGETYSNIVRIKRVSRLQPKKIIKKQSLAKKPIVSKRRAMGKSLLSKKSNLNEHTDDFIDEDENIYNDNFFDDED